MAESVVTKHLAQILGGISQLTENHPRFSIPLLILVYSGIDQFSWLNTRKDKHGPADFKEWVEKYMFPHHQMSCSAEQLWAARNGIIDMGTAESLNTRNGVRKLAYSVGPSPHQNIPEEYDLISADVLTQAFIEGAFRFIEDLNENPGMHEIAERKAKNIVFLQ
ncbi:hypothetical protein [Stutzerimonas nitrititolerans]|uniref:hypothetical protein n=1 Tax=Stutzerimonas nitrititolerans TaxID=2482751 RepID=UPI0028A750CD|nr:hypothetical protein [Stutzerimonas nitrititolerans]